VEQTNNFMKNQSYVKISIIQSSSTWV